VIEGKEYGLAIAQYPAKPHPDANSPIVNAWVCHGISLHEVRGTASNKFKLQLLKGELTELERTPSMILT